MSDESIPENAPQRRVLFDDPKLDQVVQMIVAMGAELSTALLAIDTLTRLLSDKGVLTQHEVKTYAPSADAQAERTELLRTLVRNIMHGLEADLPDGTAGATPEKGS